MKISYDLLMYYIQKLQIVKNHIKQHNVEFEGVHYFSIQDQFADLSEKYLYVGNLSEVFSQKALLCKYLTILAREDISLSAQEWEEIPCNLILVSSQYEVAYLLNHMIEVFQHLTNWDKDMHIAALEGKSPQHLLELSQTMIAYPMVLFDAGFNVVAYSKEENIHYSTFLTTIRNGYTGANTMKMVKQQDIFSKLKKNRIVESAAAEDPESNMIYFVFSDQSVVLGYGCIFLGNDKMDVGYLDLVGIFVDNMNFLLKYSLKDRLYGQMMSETFLLNLVNSVDVSQERLHQQLENLDGLTEYGNFVLGVISLEEQDAPITYLARILDQEMWDVKPFIYEKKICLFRTLKDEMEPGKVEDWQKENLDHILCDYSYTLGVSNRFTHITDLSHAFRQAQRAIHFGDMENKVICYYSDYTYYDLFHVMESQMPIEHLRLGIYEQMKAYDEAHRTQYHSIMMTYLESDCNATHTSEKLFLHRNTVRKAILFIEEYWKISFEDQTLKEQLILAKLVDNYIKLVSTMHILKAK